MRRFDAQAYIEEALAKLRAQVAKLDGYSMKPGLATVLIGSSVNDIDRQNKIRDLCGQAGFYWQGHVAQEDVTFDAIKSILYSIGMDERIHGAHLLVDPHADLSFNLSHAMILMDPHKDIDMANPATVGDGVILPRLRLRNGSVLTESVIACLGEELEKASYLIALVGYPDPVADGAGPLANLTQVLSAMGHTVFRVNPDCEVIADLLPMADIIISAANKPGYITGDMLMTGSIVVNVGMTFDEDNGVFVPDIMPEDVEDVALLYCDAAAIEPLMFLQNTLIACLNWGRKPHYIPMNPFEIQEVLMAEDDGSNEDDDETPSENP